MGGKNFLDFRRKRCSGVSDRAQELSYARVRKKKV